MVVAVFYADIQLLAYPKISLIEGQGMSFCFITSLMMSSFDQTKVVSVCLLGVAFYLVRLGFGFGFNDELLRLFLEFLTSALFVIRQARA